MKKSKNSKREKLIMLYKALNPKGKRRLIEYAEMLNRTDKYILLCESNGK